MNFAAALAEVLRVTGRPDKVADATMAINKAISYCTLIGEFRKDTVESSIAIDPTLYGATISLASLTRFRRFKYIKPIGVRYYLKELDGDKIFTPKNSIQRDVFYVAGTSLTYTLGALATSLELAYYSYAQELDSVTNNTHWMLDMLPYAIIDLACARIFSIIGDDASAAKHEKSGMDFFLVVRRDSNMGM